MGPEEFEDDLEKRQVVQPDGDAEGEEADEFAGADPDDDSEIEAGDDGDDEDRGRTDVEADHDRSEADALASKGREGSVTRGQRRFQELANRAKVAEERAAAAERRAAEALAAAQERQSQEQQRQEQERLALMDPVERAEYKLQQTEARFGRELQNIKFQQQDATDRTRFESMCDRKPHFARIADEVEQQLSALRRDGVNMSREAVAWAILGREADRRAAGAKTRQTKRAAEGVQRQTVRAPRSSGDVRGGDARSGTEAQKRRARLEGQQI